MAQKYADYQQGSVSMLGDMHIAFLTPYSQIWAGAYWMQQQTAKS